MNLKHRAHRLRRCIIFAAITSIILASTAAVTAQPHAWAAVAAAQHQYGAAYAYWQFQGPGDDFWETDQVLWIDQKAPHTYWAQYFQFTGSNDGGYIGLQTDGNRFDGSTGELAIFSLWNANGVRGPACDTFTGEGHGYSCRIPFTITTGVHYRLRVWRLESDDTGTWWGGWIAADDTQQDYHIGDIRVPSAGHQRFGQLMNFTEYFGPAVPCDQVPQSTVQLTQPAANLDTSSQTYAYYSHFTRFTKLDCTDGSGTPMDYGWTHGVQLVLGTHTAFRTWLPALQGP